mgnify:FL=1|tara:strand:- start:1564 stop:1818 length:255 start_codon:yes stop_codon:yes gene_type:complete
MEKILDDIREMVAIGNDDDIVEFVEMLMSQNKALIEDNNNLVAKSNYLLKRLPDLEPEPEPEPHPVFGGTEKLEYQEGLTYPDE